MLLSTVMRAVFSVALSEPKHPAQDPTTRTVTAAVTNRPPTAHLHPDSRWNAGLVARFFYQPRGRLREQMCVVGYVSEIRPMSKSMIGLPAAKLPVFDELTCP